MLEVWEYPGPPDRQLLAEPSFRQKRQCPIGLTNHEHGGAAVGISPCDHDRLVHQWMEAIVDCRFESLIPGSMSLLRPGPAKPGSPARSAIRRHGKASACSTPGCRACWTTSRRRGFRSRRSDAAACQGRSPDPRLMCSKKLCEVAAPGIGRCGL